MIENTQQIMQENENLKAELTKARECLKATRITLGSEFWDKWAALKEARDNIGTVLSNQSEPADKGQGEAVAWGAPKTVRQLIRQLETLDQDLRPLSMLRVPASVFEDGKERVRAVHLSFSHERVEGQWLAPFKGDGEKVLAFWCRMEQPAPVASK